MIRLEIGIKAQEIMEQDFPILDSSFPLKKALEKLKENNKEACVVINNGVIYSILTYEDLLRELLNGREDLEIKEIETRDNFSIITPEEDLIDIIRRMEYGKEFFIVAGRDLGVITKERIAEINHLLFDKIKKVVR
jgi:predicted transcriptional regulator